MRGLGIYLVAGAVLALMLDYIAPLVGLGYDVGARPVTGRSAAVQIVDRRHKGDRLHIPAVIGPRQGPRRPAKIMIGCDPAVSPLTAPPQIKFPARCIAELAVEHPGPG
jgi:hypothetical protein